jgi:trk system potassium uptake protein TrkA
VGQPLGQVRAREKFGVTVNAYKRGDSPWEYATADTVLRDEDTILVGGQPDKVEAFSQLR